MRIRLGELRRIVREEAARKVNEATGGDGRPELVDANNVFHLEVGNDYKVKKMPGTQNFVGWSGDADTPPDQVRLTFKDNADGDQWEAYFDPDGYFAWGSSGDKLIVREA